MGRARQRGCTESLPAGVEIRQLKTGKSTLRIIFQYKGVRCRETVRLLATAQNIKFAERLRNEILSSIERGKFNYGEYFPKSKRSKLFGFTGSCVTVESLLKEFLIQAEKTLEYSSFESYKKVSDTHLIPTFGALPISELKSALIRNWVKSLNVTSKTVKNILIPLRAIVEQAITDELINDNPLSKVILSKLIDKTVGKSKFVVDPFDKAESTAILDNATGQEKNLFQFALFSGLRTSELIALQWEDVNWKKGVVSVRRAFVRKRTKGTKTVAGTREVILLSPAREALLEQKQYTLKAGWRIFHNPKTDAPWVDDQQIRKTCWAPLLKRAGVRYRNPYQTRHTYASMMLSKGENIMWVARQMGHADIEMIIRTYGRWIPDNASASGYKFVHDWANYLTKEEGK